MTSLAKFGVTCSFLVWIFANVAWVLSGWHDPVSLDGGGHRLASDLDHAAAILCAIARVFSLVSIYELVAVPFWNSEPRSRKNPHENP